MTTSAIETRNRLDEFIADGRLQAAAAVAQIERDIPADLVVPESKITVLPPAEKTNRWRIGLGSEDRPLHDHAWSQVLQRAEITGRRAEALGTSEWGREELARHVSVLASHSEDRVLLRSVHAEVRAVLSDSYRRIDARPAIVALIEATRDAGGLVVGARSGDLNVSIRAILPQIVEIGGDPVVLGVEFATSDFGRGAQRLARFAFRLLCSNGLIGERILRTVHLGGRLAEDIAFSDRTYRLDTSTNASAVRDIVRNALSAPEQDKVVAKLTKAQNTSVDFEAVLPALKKNLTVAEADAVTRIWTFGDETEVPAGRNAWRLSQALSAAAKSATTAERALDLEQMAGALIDNPTAGAKQLAAVAA